MKLVLFPLIILFSIPLSAQIIDDSTAQAITYWSMGDKHRYAVEYETYQVEGIDTSLRNLITYDVLVSVVDSTSKFYTIRWDYSNFTTSNSDSTMQSLMKIGEGLPVIFKTDPNGGYLEVLNWREIKEFITTVISELRKKYAAFPYMNEALDKIELLYTSKESIEAQCTKDIHQYHNFYGALYTLGQSVEGPITIPNHYGGPPIEGVFTMALLELNAEKKNFQVGSVQIINEDQLLRSMKNHFQKIINSVTKEPIPFNVSKVSDKNVTVSNMHNSGWVLWSFQKSSVTIDEIIKMETRRITLTE